MSQTAPNGRPIDQAFRRMVASVVSLARHHPRLLAICLGGWVVLATVDGTVLLPDVCASSATMGAVSAGFAAAFIVNSWPTLALSWLAMLLAMMSLLLARPIADLSGRVAPGRRNRAVAWFAAGYLAIWAAAGVAMTLLTIALGLLAQAIALPVWLVVAAIALLWQAAPLKQACLNRCHDRSMLRAIGWRADAGALRYGASHGLECVGACWALMLLPLASGSAHLAAMAAVTLVLVAERARAPRPPRWGFAWPLRRTLPVFPKPAIVRSSL